MPPKNFVASQITGTLNVVLTWEIPDFMSITGEPTGYRLTRDSEEAIVLSELSYIDLDLSVGSYTYSLVALYSVGKAFKLPPPAPPINVGGIETVNEIKESEAVSISINVDPLPVYMPPKNFTGIQVENTYNVYLSWEVPDYMTITGAPTSYKITRDAEEPFHVLGLSYTQNVFQEGEFNYTISAFYGLEESETIDIMVTVAIVSDIDKPIVIKTGLIGNFPNPFNPTTTIFYDVKEEGHVRIDVFNIRGQRMVTLVDEHKTTGNYSVDWLGIDETGKNLASGIYLYQMRAEGYTSIKRMILLK